MLHKPSDRMIELIINKELAVEILSRRKIPDLSRNGGLIVMGFILLDAF
jgi:hypothetical protein